MECQWELGHLPSVPPPLPASFHIALFPGSHTPERKHWSCAGVESLVFFLTWEAAKDRREVDATLIVRGRMRLRTEKGTKVADNLLHISSYRALNNIHTERWSIVGWTTCKTLPFCFGPILITSCLRRKDTRLSTRYIFAFQESLGMRLVFIVRACFSLSHWLGTVIGFHCTILLHFIYPFIGFSSAVKILSEEPGCTTYEYLQVSRLKVFKSTNQSH